MCSLSWRLNSKNSVELARLQLNLIHCSNRIFTLNNGSYNKLDTWEFKQVVKLYLPEWKISEDLITQCL
jgi:hypothetical protein